MGVPGGSEAGDCCDVRHALKRQSRLLDAACPRSSFHPQNTYLAQYGSDTNGCICFGRERRRLREVCITYPAGGKYAQRKLRDCLLASATNLSQPDHVRAGTQRSGELQQPCWTLAHLSPSAVKLSEVPRRVHLACPGQATHVQVVRLHLGHEEVHVDLLRCHATRPQAASSGQKKQRTVSGLLLLLLCLCLVAECMHGVCEKISLPPKTPTTTTLTAPSLRMVS